MTAASIRTAMSMSLRAGATTDVGRVRDHNEDSVLAAERVFVVADGMGGHAAGEVASTITIETLGELAKRSTLTRDDLVEALRESNARILRSVARHPEQTGMGTTVAGLTIVSTGGSDHWAVFNIGDSRVYRVIDGRLNSITVDHSEVRELIDSGVITETEALRHPLRNVVTRSLGSEAMPTPDIWVFPPHPGERFVICSDGLSNELSDEQILAVVTAHDEPQEAAEALARAAVEAGGRDNVSVIVVALDAQPDEDVDVDTAPRAGTHRNA